jgi:hypothetical protein
VTRSASMRLISFILLSAGTVLCQVRPFTDLARQLQLDGSNSHDTQPQEMTASRSFPDAPSSVQPPTQPEEFPTLVNPVRSLSTQGAAGVGARLIHETAPAHFFTGPQPRFVPQYKAAFTEEEPSSFRGEYQYPSSLQRTLRYHPSTSGSFMGRASDAASRIFVTRDDSGKARLNTSYFLGVLASVAIHTAYRPYWTRSTSATFNNFGSTIGSDAGLNVFHEFQPAILQMVKGHTPKFVFRIGAPVTNDPPRGAVSTPAR